LAVAEPDTPVFELEFFVWLDIAVVLEQILQAMAGEAEST